MTTTRPLFYDAKLKGGPIALCAPCVSVLVMHGELAGDPSDGMLLATDVKSYTPRAPRESDACDNCESLKRYEAHRPVLRSPPARLARILTFREHEGDDVALNSY